MSEKHDKPEKSCENKGILARSARNASKKARRAQTKIKQRVGKGDETKDEVFDEFVLNFNKQTTSAARLHTELKNYLCCVTAMRIAATNFSEAVKDVYEQEWSSRDQLIQLFKEADANWVNLNSRLTEEVLEPLTSYQKTFIDVKNKILKRSRKLVDYDHSRHTVDTHRAKGATKSSESKKLNQAEEDYQKAKDVFIDMTSDLYEELPALYDSRIGFYVSCFQSVFTLEEVFHREAAIIEHQLNDLMDQLITDFSAGAYSTRKPFSAGLETTSNSSEKEDNDSKLSSGSLAQFYDVAVPDSEDVVDSGHSEDTQNLDSSLENNVSAKESATKNENTSVPIQPARPAPRPPGRPSTLPNRPIQPNIGTPPPPPRPNLPNHDSTLPARPAQPKHLLEEVEKDSEKFEPAVTSEEVVNVKPEETESPTVQETTESAAATTTEVINKTMVAYKNIISPDNPNKCNLVVPISLYKVITTHKYVPEDEDELSFEKGEIVHVIPYEDPEEQDDGWLMGVMDLNGLTGVFPENFSKIYT